MTGHEDAMDDPYELALAMLTLALAALGLVAGELYLVTEPNPPPAVSAPATIPVS
jgi:hypothetical protein